MPNTLTLERQRAIEQELRQIQEPQDANMEGASPADIATKISALARIVSELLAILGVSDYAQALDGERARRR